MSRLSRCSPVELSKNKIMEKITVDLYSRQRGEELDIDEQDEIQEDTTTLEEKLDELN